MALDVYISYASFISLIAAIVVQWVDRTNRMAVSLVALGAVLSLISARIDALGLLFIGAFLIACHFFYRPNVRVQYRIALGVSVLVFGLLLIGHQLPGFHKLTLFTVTLSSDAIPYTFQFFYDKPWVGIGLLAFHAKLTWDHADWRKTLRSGTFVFLVGFPIVLFLAFLLGYVRWDPKLPASTLLWVFLNLFKTCTAEEAFFRGFIQRQLESLLSKHSYGRWISLIIASLLFGLAHFAGGIKYVALAFVAGLYLRHQLPKDWAN